MFFQEGDRVRMIEDYRPGVREGDCGTVIMYDDLGRIIIEWDDYSVYKHDADRCVKQGHGWFVSELQIEHIQPTDFGEFSPNLAPGSIANLFGG